MESIRIKFRVWNHHYKKFLSTPDGLIFRDVFNDRLTSTLDEAINCYDYGYDRKCNIVQQFTGLVDKNGKEIYEGDILKCKGYDGWFDNVGFYYNMPVKYKELKMGETTSSGFLYIPEDREIIGHINIE